MADIHEIASDYRRRLAERGAAAEAGLMRAYGSVWDAVSDDVARLASELEEAFRDDRPLPTWRVREYERSRVLLRQIEGEVGQIAEGYGATLARLQAEAVVLGRGATLALLAAGGFGDLVALPNTALADLVGRLQDGSPLRTLLDGLGPDAARRVERALVEGVGRGIGPREIAREMRDGLGGNMARELTISRTEVVGSYRRASHRQAEDHRELIEGWVWLAAVDSIHPPCVVCLAMHGTWHPMEEELHSHPGCRCAAAYRPKGSQVDLSPDGVEWFDEQPEDVQRAILGPGALAAWQDGLVGLDAFVMETSDPRWGSGLRRAPLAVAMERRR